jgi:penicillin-binding protein 2
MYGNRNKIILGVFSLLFLVLSLRLFYLQIINGRNLSTAAVNQRTTNSDIEKPRGRILDRNLIPFTNRNVKHSVVLKPLYLRDRDDDLYRVCELLGLDFNKTKKEMETGREPVFYETDEETKNRIVGMKINGVSIINSLKRYGDTTLARHVLGYLNRVDQTGEAGIEKSYEEALKYDSEDAVTVTTDARNNLVQGLGYRLLKLSGMNKKLNVKLTLDYHIQHIVEDVMDRKGMTGAVVVEDVVNGDIVAMASKPDFQQNDVGRYLDSPHNELFNRAVASYNLGSVFKIIDASLFFEKGQEMPDDFMCSGYIKVGDKEFKCSSYDKGGHGSIDFSRAFALSCNPYFIDSAIRSGYKDLVIMADRFGIGRHTGIDRQGMDESSGHLPDPYSYYSNGDIANISIGQGEIMATPLQVADIVATIANGGIKNTLNIVDSIVDDEGKKIRNLRIKEGKRIISKGTADKVKELMEEVTSTGTGTRAGLADFGGAAGKTGSAETSRKDIVHAWFAGYFPLKNPKYSVAVFVEGGSSGGDVAAPVFTEVAERIIAKGF